LNFGNTEGSDIDSTVAGGGVLVNEELERILKETFVIFFKLLSPCVLGKDPSLASYLVEIQESFISQIQIRSFSSYTFFFNNA
jgi:hypothetical protein